MNGLTRHERDLSDKLQYVTLTAPVHRDTVRNARQSLALFRGAHGFKIDGAVRLLTDPVGNVKLAKSERPSYSLSLSPATSGGWNVCPASTPECRAHCVAYAGKGSMATVIRGRAWKTDALLHSPRAFITLLVHEIDRAVAKHGRIAVRLNAFSDIRWEAVMPTLFTRWGAAVTFYDYTKRADRSPHVNYHLTRSATEHTSEADIGTDDRNWAVIFRVRKGQPLPATYGGRRVIDGDETDYRPGDETGVVVGLKAKGSLRTVESTFVKEGS